MRDIYTIDEVAKIFNITTNRIIFYEKHGLLPIRKFRDKNKKYNLNDIMILQSILLYRAIGLSIESIKNILNNNEKEDYLISLKKQSKILNNEIYRLNNIKQALDNTIFKLNKKSNYYYEEKDLIRILNESNIVNFTRNSRQVKFKIKSRKKKKKILINSILVLVISFSMLKLITKVEENNTTNKVLGSNIIDKSEIITQTESTKINQEIKSGENLGNNRNSEYLIISNKETPIGEEYYPNDLEIPSVVFQDVGNEMVKYLRQEAARALENLFNEAEGDGINLIAISGYRSYDYQVTIYNTEVNNEGEVEANKYVAYPGESEHQLGLAIDVLSDEYSSLDEGFENTEAFRWLETNMSRFGFILRYPKGKEDITGYGYEPWHLRYVGVSPAQEIMDSNITLEEYMNSNIN